MWTYALWGQDFGSNLQVVPALPGTVILTNTNTNTNTNQNTNKDTITNTNSRQSFYHNTRQHQPFRPSGWESTKDTIISPANESLLESWKISNLKHCKNCEGCPLSLFIEGSRWCSQLPEIPSIFTRGHLCDFSEWSSGVLWERDQWSLSDLWVCSGRW